MTGDRTCGLVPRHNEQQKEVAEFVISKRLVFHCTVEQHTDNIVPGIGPMFSGKLLGQHKHLHHSHCALLLGGREFGVIHTYHDIGELKQAAAFLKRYARQLTDSDKRQLSCHILYEFTATPLHSTVENIPGHLPESRLIRVYFPGGERIAHNPAVLEVFGWIHIDYQEPHHCQHFRVLLMQKAGFQFGRK